jgi:hypothetical protein
VLGTAVIVKVPLKVESTFAITTSFPIAKPCGVLEVRVATFEVRLLFVIETLTTGECDAPDPPTKVPELEPVYQPANV